jgi:hypothetical protein
VVEQAHGKDLHFPLYLFWRKGKVKLLQNTTFADNKENND